MDGYIEEEGRLRRRGGEGTKREICGTNTSFEYGSTNA